MYMYIQAFSYRDELTSIFVSLDSELGAGRVDSDVLRYFTYYTNLHYVNIIFCSCLNYI